MHTLNAHQRTLAAALIGLMAGAHSAAARSDLPTLNTTLSDEFSDASTLPSWALGPSTTWDLMDMDATVPGHLAVAPTDLPSNGWYEDYTGPFHYKLVTGDFVAVTRVRAGQTTDLDQPPTGLYNSAGILARDPTSLPGTSNWVHFNLGYQASALGTETKITQSSSSALYLTDSDDAHEGVLGMCRVGANFYTWRLMDGAAAWEATETLTHTTLPATLQVGLEVNGWQDSDLLAAFDYLRVGYGAGITAGDCLDLVRQLAGDLGDGSLSLSTGLSDEFSAAGTLSQWTEGPSSAWDTLDIDTTTAGHLTIEPTDLYGNGWYESNQGPFRYKTVDGDFVAVTHVVAGNLSDPQAPPTGWFNAAGLLVRDGASATGERWIAYNLGYQDNAVGTEAKVTVDGFSDLQLQSTSGVNGAALAVCRVDDTFYTFRLLDGASAWEQTRTLIEPASFPAQVQVGPMANGWQDADLSAAFDYVRVAAGQRLNHSRCLEIAQALAAGAPADPLVVP